MRGTGSFFSVGILFSILTFACHNGAPKDLNNKNQRYTKVNDSTYHIIKYQPNGNKKEEYYIDDVGNLKGKYYKWDQKGRIYLDWNYYQGKRHGEQITYWEPGKKSLVQSYRYGILDGTSVHYKPNGEYISVEEYRQGKLVSRKVCPDYSRPTSIMLHSFMSSSGIDSLTADSLLRLNFQGYIIKTDSGIYIKEDQTVNFKMDSLNQALKTMHLKKAKSID